MRRTRYLLPLTSYLLLLLSLSAAAALATVTRVTSSVPLRGILERQRPSH